MAAAVPGNTGGERSAAIAEQEPAPPPAENAAAEQPAGEAPKA
jgi:hypothetical protein